MSLLEQLGHPDPKKRLTAEQAITSELFVTSAVKGRKPACRYCSSSFFSFSHARPAELNDGGYIVKKEAKVQAVQQATETFLNMASQGEIWRRRYGKQADSSTSLRRHVFIIVTNRLH